MLDSTTECRNQNSPNLSKYKQDTSCYAEFGEETTQLSFPQPNPTQPVARSGVPDDQPCACALRVINKKCVSRWDFGNAEYLTGESKLPPWPRHGFNSTVNVTWIAGSWEVWVLHPAGESSQTWPGISVNLPKPFLLILSTLPYSKDSCSNFSLSVLLFCSFLISWWKARHGTIGRLFNFKKPYIVLWFIFFKHFFLHNLLLQSHLDTVLHPSSKLPSIAFFTQRSI